MKAILYLALLVSVAYFAQAQDYIIQNDGTASATVPKPVTMKTVTTGLTAPKTLKITFEYQFGADKTGTNNDRDLIVCCVTAVSASTDNLAKFATDRCFSSQVILVTTPADAATKVKHVFAAGTKSTTNYVPNSFIGTPAGTGADFAARTAAFLYTSPAYEVDNGQLATIGLLTSVPGTLTYTCNRAVDHATSNTLVAGTAVAIPGGTATTFTVTGTGTACSTSSTSKSNAFVQSIASVAMLSAVLALILA